MDKSGGMDGASQVRQLSLNYSSSDGRGRWLTRELHSVACEWGWSFEDEKRERAQ